MSSTFTWITAVLLVVGPIAESGFSAPPNPVLDLCFIKAKFGFDITVPAQETGLLTDVLVSQGQTVKQGELLAQIDDTQPKMQLEVAQHQREKAEKEYNDEIRVEYAKASRDVAQKELDINKQLNQRLPGSVPAIKIDQFDLKVKEANLQVKKVTTIDKELAELEVSVKQAEVKAANKAIERRQVLARFDGIVEEIRLNGTASGKTLLRSRTMEAELVGRRVPLSQREVESAGEAFGRLPAQLTDIQRDRFMRLLTWCLLNIRQLTTRSAQPFTGRFD